MFRIGELLVSASASSSSRRGLPAASQPGGTRPQAGGTPDREDRRAIAFVIPRPMSSLLPHMIVVLLFTGVVVTLPFLVRHKGRSSLGKIPCFPSGVKHDYLSALKLFIKTAC